MEIYALFSWEPENSDYSEPDLQQVFYGVSYNKQRLYDLIDDNYPVTDSDDKSLKLRNERLTHWQITAIDILD